MTASVAEALRALHLRGRAAWPDIELEFAAFAALAARTLGDGPFGDVRADELYLALACAANVDRAICALDGRYLARIVPALVRRGQDAATAADILQELRERFLVGTPGGAPRIAEYDGRGSLAAWIQVAAHRAAISANRKLAREVLVDDIEIAAAARSPDLDLLQRRFGQAFEAAFRCTFAGLTPRARNLLRYQAIDRLGIDRIAALHGVHRATAARWLVQARDALRAGIRRCLQDWLRIDADEVDSLFALFESRLELSLRLLATPTPKQASEYAIPAAEVDPAPPSRADEPGKPGLRR
jgi:RNA polymerase sigma-70 factor, ECF subfamily